MAATHTRTITILYGSQTGCAQETAERIAREARRRHFRPVLSAMDEFSRATLPEQKCVVFVCSVTGQGEEPDNMKKFWRFLLRKDLPSDSLEGVEVAVFGQGDSSYAKFNYPAKKLYRRVLQLGATSLLERGDGDDQHPHGIDGALDPWLESFWKVIMGKYPLAPGVDVIPDNVMLPNTYHLTFLDENAQHNEHAKDRLPCRTKIGPIEGSVMKNSRITTETHFQDVRHIEIDIPEECIYTPGSVFEVWPRNLEDRVQEVITFLEWNNIADKPLVISINKEAYPDLTIPWRLSPKGQNNLTISGVTTIRELFTNHLDIFGRPRRFFFELLSFFALDETQHEKLVEFASAQGQDELYTYAHRPKRTAFEVLQDFHSVKIPLQYLLDLFPFLRPRSFSIASEATCHKKQIHLTVAVVEYKTRMAKPRTGICTQWMKTWVPGDVIDFRVSKGLFRIPPRIHTPAIFVGLGTGIAPLRGLIYARLLEISQTSSPSSEADQLPQNMLFFGCRSKKADYYYQNEWESFAQGAIPFWINAQDNTTDKARHEFHIIPAFSRDQKQKIYVQHRILEHGQRVFDWIVKQNGYIYVCGNSVQKPDDVRDAFREVLEVHGHMSVETASEYISKMEACGRYQQESWS